MDIKTHTEKRENVIVLTILQEKLTHHHAAPLKEQIFLEIAGGNNRIALLLKNVKRIDSSSLSALLFGKRQTTQAGGDLVLIAVQPEVKSMIRIAQLSHVFRIFPTIDEAVAFLKEKNKSTD